MSDDYDELKLENQLCFPLYVCSKEIVRRYTPILEKIGLTYTSYLVMLVLWEDDNLSVNELGNRLWLDSGTLTPLLKKMEAQGLVHRIRMEHDERRVKVSLTEKGHVLRKDALPVPFQIGSCLSLGKNEMKTLYALLYQVMKGMKS
ncbi:MAG: MarR family transcriptional regulator [Sphaerochaetaceae bacterium]|jgi:DNA-binding MarR family transcriptional regulator